MWYNSLPATFSTPDRNVLDTGPGSPLGVLSVCAAKKGILFAAISSYLCSPVPKKDPWPHHQRGWPRVTKTLLLVPAVVLSQPVKRSPRCLWFLLKGHILWIDALEIDGPAEMCDLLFLHLLHPLDELVRLRTKQIGAKYQCRPCTFCFLSTLLTAWTYGTRWEVGIRCYGILF